LRSAMQRQSEVGSIRDDERWSSPLPLRFEGQLAVLFLGALDAYDVTTGILRARASQQSFNGLRFQVEALTLLRWMTEPDDARERQVRAYRVLCGQLVRWGRLLKEDARGEPDAVEGEDTIEQWEVRLRELAKLDGITHLRSEPDRRYLFTEYLTGGGYPTFSMFSELGSHPGAVGNILFSLRAESREIDYSLGEAWLARAFWSAAAMVHLWQTCEVVARRLGWNEWLTKEALPIFTAAGPLIEDAARRRKEARDSGS
jgi:hypothetical protein